LDLAGAGLSAIAMHSISMLLQPDISVLDLQVGWIRHHNGVLHGQHGLIDT